MYIKHTHTHRAYREKSLFSQSLAVKVYMQELWLLLLCKGERISTQIEGEREGEGGRERKGEGEREGRHDLA